MNDKKPVVFVEELAEMLGTSRRTIYKHLRARTFPIPEIKGIDLKHRWARSTVEEFIARNGQMEPTRRGKAA